MGTAWDPGPSVMEESANAFDVWERTVVIGLDQSSYRALILHTKITNLSLKTAFSQTF